MRSFSEQELDRITKEELVILSNKGLLLDPFQRALQLRPLMVKAGKYLVSDFTGTQQLDDIRVRNDSLIDKPLFEQGLTALVYRSKIWVKQKDPVEREKVDLPPCDYTDNQQLWAALRQDDVFDVNLWFGPVKTLLNFNLPFTFQTLGCNFHDAEDMLGCYFCFVDKENNCPESQEGVWIDEQNVLDTYEAARSNSAWIEQNHLAWIAEHGGLNHVRHSGGQPTLHLDLTLRIADEMKKRGLPVNLMYDTNLSTAAALNQWTQDGTFPSDILARLGQHKVRILCAFKGTNDENIQYNTQSTLTLEQQFDELEMHVAAGEQCYLYVYNPNPFTLNSLIDQGMDRLGPSFLPMLHLANINIYGPTKQHIGSRAKILEKDPDEYLAHQKDLFQFMVTRSREVIEERCQLELGLGYKQVPRGYFYSGLTLSNH